MTATLAGRMAEAVDAVISRFDPTPKLPDDMGSPEFRDQLVAAVVGQVADIFGRTLEPFRRAQIDKPADAPLLAQVDVPMTWFAINNLQGVARLFAGDGEMTVPPRRFYICETRKPGADVSTITFVRFESENVTDAERPLVTWDLLDPSWPEVSIVLGHLEAAIEAQDRSPQ